VIRMMNRPSTKRLGIQKKGTGRGARADMETTLGDLDAIGDEVREALKKALHKHGKIKDILILSSSKPLSSGESAIETRPTR